MTIYLFRFNSDGDEKTQQAKALLKYVDQEIDSIQKCADCYLSANKRPKTWFRYLCNEPHLIVWAKITGHCHWPAKVMTVDGQQVNVRFFGDHLNANVPAANCFLYSAKSPRPRSSSKSPRYNKALSVCNHSDFHSISIRFSFDLNQNFEDSIV